MRLKSGRSWALGLAALVTQSCCSSRPAPMVPWQPGCQGTQVVTEPRRKRPEPRGHGEELQKQENRRERRDGRDRQVRPRGGCGVGGMGVAGAQIMV